MKSTKGILLVLTAAVISGFAIFLNKWGVKGLDPYFFTFAKNLIVALLLTTAILLIYRLKEFKSLTNKNWLTLILVGLIGGSIPFLLFFKGLAITSAAQASLFHKTLFVWLIPISWIFLKKKINKYELIAALVILSGSICYFQYRPEAFNRGDFLILIATMMWAFEIALSKKLLKNLSAFTVAWGRMFFGTIFILIFLIAKQGLSNMIPGDSLGQYIWIVISSIILFAYVITFYNGLKYIPAFTATAILSLGAPLTALLSLVFIDQTILPLKILGIILLSLGVYLVIFQHRLWSKKTLSKS